MNSSIISHYKKTIFILLILFCLVFLLLPYLHPHILLPRVEELNYSLYPLILWAKQVLNGHVPMWFSDVGLGVPWPVPHTMSHTPFMLLFGILPVYIALAILLTAHIALQSFFTLRLCSYFELTPLISAVVLLSVLLASPMEYLIASDAAAVYLGWTLLPMMLYALLRLLEANDKIHLLMYTSLLAFSAGYGILNCHIGVFSAYLIGLALIALLQPKSSIPRWHWFLVLTLLSLGIGAEKIYSLAYELSYFSSKIERLQQTHFGFFRSFWNLFLKPFVLSKSVLNPAYLEILTATNQMSRTLTFGSPLCTLLLSTYAIFYLWYKKGWYTISPLQKAMWLTLGICFLAEFMPTTFLPPFISASWAFRDLAIFLGLFLAGILCDFWLRPKLTKGLFHWLLATHFFLLLITAVFFHYSWTWQGNGTPSGLYNSLSAMNTEFPLYKMLNQALTCNGSNVGCEKQTRRVVYDGRAAFHAHRSSIAETGLHLNSLPLRGFQEVSFIHKGRSLDSIHPSQSKPYGMISTLGFQKYQYIPNAFDWVQQSPAMLNLLGIRAIVGLDVKDYIENGLVRVGILNPHIKDPTERLAVYYNPHAFPRAFFVNDLDLAKVKPHEKCDQNDNFLTCMDVSDLVKSTNPWVDLVHLEEKDNYILMTFAPSSQSRTLLVSSMWRPEWQSKEEKIDSFYGLIKLTIPPNRSMLLLEYYPKFFIYSRWLTFFCIIIAVLCLSATILLQFLSKIRRKEPQVVRATFSSLFSRKAFSPKSQQ